jgi:aryl-alcohol dehydrogenase-like predicted oxidoreductase
MRNQRLGAAGPHVSLVGLGCNNFGSRLDVDGTRAVVDAAIASGVTFFDTADMYGDKGGSETALGVVLRGRRDEVVLATKFGHDKVDMGYGDLGPKGARTYIRRALEESLRRLQTDHVDLYQMHAPDPSTPIADTLTALDELVREGKVRYIGSSQFSGAQVTEAAAVARELGITAFVSAQNHWSLLERDVEDDTVPAAAAEGIGMLPFFPLANGLLTGKIRRATGIPDDSRLAGNPGYVTDEKLFRVEQLAGWAEQHDRTLLEVAIGWLAGQPSIGSVIAGATKAEQVRANAAAIERPLTADELAEVDAISRGAA